MKDIAPAVAKEAELESNVSKLKKLALAFIVEDQRDWLVDSMKRASSLDNIVSTLRHVDGGQIYILKELLKISPEMKWYRGGSLTKWKDVIGSAGYSHFTEEQLNTVVIDGGANGALGREDLAQGFNEMTSRENPVVYEVSLGSLIDGLEKKQIQLVSEHDYDLMILQNDDHAGYLDFCKKHLKLKE